MSSDGDEVDDDDVWAAAAAASPSDPPIRGGLPPDAVASLKQSIDAHLRANST